MDQRQTKIVEGAGLSESRINQELIDFLNKWSFPALLVVALISGGYFAKNWFEQQGIRKRDEGFAQLGALESVPNPSVYSLTEIAEQYRGAGSVPELARLKAADVHLQGVRTGLDPADGVTPLSAEDRAFHLDKAEGLYRRVLDATAGDADKALIAANAAFGLAATAESRGDAPEAERAYEQAKTFAEQAGYPALARAAETMLAGMREGTAMVLYEAAQLPRMPYDPEPSEAQPEGPAGPELPAGLPTDPPAETPADPPDDDPAPSPAEDPPGGIPGQG
jgi:hypothetical protein